MGCSLCDGGDDLTGAAQADSFPQIRQSKPVRELLRAFDVRLTNQSAR
jgi:hypothetical protein